MLKGPGAGRGSRAGEQGGGAERGEGVKIGSFLIKKGILEEDRWETSNKT